MADLIKQDNKTENPCVGGSIPPPATIFTMVFANFYPRILPRKGLFL